jgi:uncharacterized membrane protein YbhN (UPF0104 family)
MGRWALRVAVSAIVAVIMLTIVPFRSVVGAISRISIFTWVASLLVFFAGHYLNAVKLRLLLGSGAAPLSSCVQAQYAGLVGNLGLPGLAGGDLVRAAYLIPTAGAKRVAAASVADRVVDTVTLLVLVAIALPLAGVPKALADILPSAQWMLAVMAGAALLLAVLSVVVWKNAVLKIKVGALAMALRERRGDVLTAVVISFGVQSAFVLTNAWLASDVGVATPVAAWFVAWPLSKLVAVLPISLGGIGVREAALVSLLVPYGAPGDAVLATGILWQTVLAVSGLAGLVATQWFWRSGPTARPATGSNV